MPAEFGGKWGTECLNTWFPLLTLPYVGYSVKMKKKLQIWLILLRYLTEIYPSSIPITYLHIFIPIHNTINIVCNQYRDDTCRGAGAQNVTIKPTGCGFDPHSRKWNIYLNLYFHFFALVSRQSPALSFATQHAMPAESGRKWRTVCLNTKFPLPTLLCAGHSWFILFSIKRYMYLYELF